MPKVSIGLPVFNGEKYLGQALDSLLGQTFDDLEIIVGDNASSDGTAEIVRDFAGRDRRVRSFRNETNIGAAPNFNRVYSQATGTYFKWAAADDLCSADFIERCAAQLDDDSGLVLCHSKTIVIDEHGHELERYDVEFPTARVSPSARYGGLLKGHRCYQVFGLIRRAALARTPLMGSYANGDGILLARLAMLGRFHRIPEFLFMTRRHPEQSMAMIGKHREYAEWFDPKLKKRFLFPMWRRQYELLTSIGTGSLGLRERASCLRHWCRSTYLRRGSLANDIKKQVRQFTGPRPA